MKFMTCLESRLEDAMERQEKSLQVISFVLASLPPVKQLLVCLHGNVDLRL